MMQKTAIDGWGGAVDYKVIMQMFARDVPMPLAEVSAIVARAAQLFAREPNLLYIEEPVCVVGDLHGQLADLYRVLQLGGAPDATKFLFLGDYVDRGAQGLEVVILLFALKLRFPNRVFLLRGNHESRNATDVYGFRAECARKYGAELWTSVTAAFDRLPLAAVINGHFFAVHGGLSPELTRAADLNRLARVAEPPLSGLLTDLLWADPADEPSAEWAPNTRRGCSVRFGPAETFAFLRANALHVVLRAHECVNDGFEARTFGADFPVVVTLFSAEDYCGTQNRGAVLRIADRTLHVIQFHFALQSREALFLQFGDAFDWSLPLLGAALAALADGFLDFTLDALAAPPPPPLDSAALAQLGISSSALADAPLSPGEQRAGAARRSSRLGVAITGEAPRRSLGLAGRRGSGGLYDAGEDFFGAVVERRRSDFFRENAPKAHVNEDAVFNIYTQNPPSTDQSSVKK